MMWVVELECITVVYIGISALAGDQKSEDRQVVFVIGDGTRVENMVRF
jgi:hypothetical protein